MSDSPTLAIQYVNYKTRDYLRSSLTDVMADAQSSALDYKVYILDNASGDNLRDLEREKVAIKYSDTNVGFGAGHNLLASLHDSEYTLLLNPDTRFIEPDTIARLIASLASSPSVAAVGPRLLGRNEEQQEWDHGELDFTSGDDSPGSYWKPRADAGEVAWVSGAASLLRTAAFKSVGGFDEKFFLYKEEEDLFLRLRQKGYTIHYDPSIAIVHIGSVVANKHSRHFEQSIAYYNQKHGL